MFLLLLHDNLDLCCSVDGEVPVSASHPQQFTSMLFCRWRCPCFCFSSTTIQICAVMQMEMCLFLLLLHNNLDLCCYVDGEVPVSAFSSTTIQICAVMQMERSMFLLLLHNNCCQLNVILVDGCPFVSLTFFGLVSLTCQWLQEERDGTVSTC